MKLVFATHNKNKLKEVQELVPAHIELLSLTDINCHEDIPETEPTIEGNAKLKADYVRLNYGLNCFADDTGLEVTALNGAPGVFSARYAGPGNDAQANMSKLLQNLEGIEDRSAQFKTVIALSLDASEKSFTGICEGQIIEQPRGEKGFGYDPIFQPKGYQQTFAEISSEEKGKISHRGKAIRELVGFLGNLMP
ncbi:MAG: non-canonical purine NTP diphosphatase [Bacteroidota bacterium]